LKHVILVDNKCKVVPVISMKACGGMEVQFHRFLTFELDGGEWSVSPEDRKVFVPTEYDAVWVLWPVFQRM
jgi:hypothetical protein